MPHLFYNKVDILKVFQFQSRRVILLLSLAWYLWKERRGQVKRIVSCKAKVVSPLCFTWWFTLQKDFFWVKEGVRLEEMFVFRRAWRQNVCFLDVPVEEILISAAAILFWNILLYMVSLGTYKWLKQITSNFAPMSDIVTVALSVNVYQPLGMDSFGKCLKLAWTLLVNLHNLAWTLSVNLHNLAWTLSVNL
jgi:hypothetical protein